MSTSPAAVETLGLEKRYGRTWGLQDCSFRLPEGRIAGLVGPNGAGKSTLLRMLAGISTPSAGEMSVLGQRPGSQNADALARVGYLDQERPLYRGFRVAEMLRFGSSAAARAAGRRGWNAAQAAEAAARDKYVQLSLRHQPPPPWRQAARPVTPVRIARQDR